MSIKTIKNAKCPFLSDPPDMCCVLPSFVNNEKCYVAYDHTSEENSSLVETQPMRCKFTNELCEITECHVFFTLVEAALTNACGMKLLLFCL